MINKLVLVTFVVLVTAQSASTQVQENSFDHIKPVHQKVIKRWLATKKTLRPAMELDASETDLEAWRRDNSQFFPYYVVGDFNQDGIQDFAVVLKDETKEDEGTLAIFNGPFNSSRPAYSHSGLGVRQSYLEWVKNLQLLYFTGYETHGFYLKPAGKRYVQFDPSVEQH